MRAPSNNSNGFTLIEMAIVMVIVGLLAGGGVSLISMLTKRKARTESMEYLKHAQTALISFADINGRLPWADTSGDGAENSGATSGTLPYQTLKLSPTDPYKRTLRYELDANLGTNLTTSCNALRSGLSGGPIVVDADLSDWADVTGELLSKPPYCRTLTCLAIIADY